MDSQILPIQERLQNELTLGESHFREFKSAMHGPDRKGRRKVSLVAEDIGETLVAFANADGGTLIVGAEDNGTISGLSYTEDDIAVLRNAPKSHVHSDTPLSGVRTRLVPMGDKTVLVFDVQKGTRYIHLTSNGRCLQRRDTDTVPVSSEQIRFERHEQLSREYDQQWVDGATVSDLDLDLLNRMTETVLPRLSAEKRLQFFGLAEFDQESLRLRRAALLLFASNIGKWHPRSEIRLLQVSGLELLTGSDYNVIRDETHAGNVLELLSEGWEHVRQFLGRKRLVDGTFQIQLSYPEDACREAFVNAIAHRDYSIQGRPIEIMAFDDRLEIRNPGRLLSTVDLSELRKGAGVHDSRNTYIARVLRELGHMREIGEGIRRISALLDGHELAPQKIDSVDHCFLISFSQGNFFSPDERAWLDAFSEYDLSREEKLVVLLGQGGNLVSYSQISETLGIADYEEYKPIILMLQRKGLLSSILKKGDARPTAHQQGIEPGQVPRFAIQHPDSAQGDQIARRYRMGTKREFTIQRGGRLERTIVGVDGQTHVLLATQQGKDGHFTHEGQYRRAIERAVAENTRSKSQ